MAPSPAPDEPTPDEPAPEEPETPEPEEPTPTPVNDGLAATCTNEADGFTVSYPEDWATNEEELDGLPACSLFDPDPGDLRTEDLEVPADVAAFLRVEAADFAGVADEDPFSEELAREEVQVDGRDAVRLELRATGEGLWPEGQETTRWTVDLDGETFVGVAHDVGEPDYAAKQRVLDEMMATVSFEG